MGIEQQPTSAYQVWLLDAATTPTTDAPSDTKCPTYRAHPLLHLDDRLSVSSTSSQRSLRCSRRRLSSDSSDTNSTSTSSSASLSSSFGRSKSGSKTAFLRSVVSNTFHPVSKQHRRLHRMKVLTEIAARRRSLDLLQEMQHNNTDLIVDDLKIKPSPVLKAYRSMSIDDDLLCLNAEDVVADDALHHVLKLQSEWLSSALTMSKARQLRGGYSHMPLALYLAKFVDRQQQPKVPTALDRPTVALVRFEKLIHRQGLLPAAAKDAFDRLCRHTMSGTISVATRVWEERAPDDVLQALVDELTEIIAKEAALLSDLVPVLHEFVEQMVFGRLASACYQTTEMTSDLDAQWLEHTATKDRAVSLQTAGLRLRKIKDKKLLTASNSSLFASTLEAFDDLPHLVPTSMLTSFMNAMQMLHLEAEDGLGVRAKDMSSDVLLPLLVYVLSRCDLPFLPAQVNMMAQFADESSEIAFYLASVQAAMGFLVETTAANAQKQ